jgi:hypothetical protein
MASDDDAAAVAVRHIWMASVAGKARRIGRVRVTRWPSWRAPLRSRVRKPVSAIVVADAQHGRLRH